jgi:hypothetical protein
MVIIGLAPGKGGGGGGKPRNSLPRLRVVAYARAPQQPRLAITPPCFHPFNDHPCANLAGGRRGEGSVIDLRRSEEWKLGTAARRRGRFVDGTAWAWAGLGWAGLGDSDVVVVMMG